MTSRSPGRWSKVPRKRGAGTRGRKNQWRFSHAVKLRHETLADAQAAARLLNEQRPAHGPWTAYDCRWSDDYALGESAPLHWHAGRDNQ